VAIAADREEFHAQVFRRPDTQLLAAFCGKTHVRRALDEHARLARAERFALLILASVPGETT
jgi:hypothetical protein